MILLQNFYSKKCIVIPDDREFNKVSVKPLKQQTCAKYSALLFSDRINEAYAPLLHYRQIFYVPSRQPCPVHSYRFNVFFESSHNSETY